MKVKVFKEIEIVMRRDNSCETRVIIKKRKGEALKIKKRISGIES